MKTVYAVAMILFLASYSFAEDLNFNIVGSESVVATMAPSNNSTVDDQKKYNLFDTVREARAAANKVKKTLIVVRLANSLDVHKYYSYAQKSKFVFHVADDDDERFNAGMTTESYKEPKPVTAPAPAPAPIRAPAPTYYYYIPQQPLQYFPQGGFNNCGPGGCST